MDERTSSPLLRKLIYEPQIKGKRQSRNSLVPSLPPKAMKATKRSGRIFLNKHSSNFDHAEFERELERRAARHEELRYRIAPDCKVHIQFNGIATQGAIKKMISYLEMGIGDFPRNAEDSATRD